MDTVIFKVTEYDKCKSLTDLVETVQKTFIAKEGYSDLINKSTNDQVISVLADKYVGVDNEWKSAIDEIAHYILGESYDPSANVFVDWNNKVVKVEIASSFVKDSKEIVDRIIENNATIETSIG